MSVLSASSARSALAARTGTGRAIGVLALAATAALSTVGAASATAAPATATTSSVTSSTSSNLTTAAKSTDIKEKYSRKKSDYSNTLKRCLTARTTGYVTYTVTDELFFGVTVRHYTKMRIVPQKLRLYVTDKCGKGRKPAKISGVEKLNQAWYHRTCTLNTSLTVGAPFLFSVTVTPECSDTASGIMDFADSRARSDYVVSTIRGQVKWDDEATRPLGVEGSKAPCIQGQVELIALRAGKKEYVNYTPRVCFHH